MKLLGIGGPCRAGAAIFYGALLASVANAQSTAEQAELNQEPLRINITAPSAEEQWRETPASVTVVEEEVLAGEQDLALDQALARIPGVFAQNRFNFSQGVRLSIRGYGARGNFGVRGVRVLLDGVPLTLPDGQTELDALDLGLLDRLEVIRGPASTLYGNGAGGVLSIDTRDAPEEPHALVDISAGELDYTRVRAEGGGSWGNVRGLAAVNATRLGGFRENSEVNSEIYTGKLAVPFSTGDLHINFNGLEIDSEDPGGLSSADVRADRSQARAANLTFDGGESISQQRLSWLWKGKPGEHLDYSLSAYAGERDFANRLPFLGGGQVAFDRIFGGIGGRTTWRGVWLGLAQQLTGGFNLEAQRDDRERFDNVNGARGASTLRQDENATAWGVFLHNDIAFAQRWNLGLGLRYDRVRLSVDDAFLANGDDSGVRDFDDVSYSGGLSYEFLRRQHLYARIASSFETPTNTELANPAGGGFNTVLQPVESVNYELGVKGEAANLRYEVVVFTIRLEDELVPFELPAQPGRSFFNNAGKSRRDGVEVSADWQAHQHWRASMAYTYSDYEFEEFARNGNDFSGNQTPGIPRQQFFGEVAYEREIWYARLNTRIQDRLFANDSNSEEVSGYGLLNLRSGFKLREDGWLIEPYAGIDNILDKEYNDNVRINAFGGRFFEPAPGRYFYAGIRASLD